MAKTKTVGVGLLQREVPDFDDPEVKREIWSRYLKAFPGSEVRPNLADEARELRARDLRQILKAANLEVAAQVALEEHKEISSEQEHSERLQKLSVAQLMHEWWLSTYPKDELELRPELRIDHSRLSELPEDSIEWLAVAWLRDYDSLQLRRSHILAGYKDQAPAIAPAGDEDQKAIQALIECAEELGRLEERIWWRTRAVPATVRPRSPKGKTPEQLAEARLRSDKPFAEQNEGRAAENAERTAHAEEWHADAQELAEAYWRRPGHSKHPSTVVAEVIHPQLIARWEEKRRAELAAGSELNDRKLPKPNTVRRYLKRPVKA